MSDEDLAKRKSIEKLDAEPLNPAVTNQSLYEKRKKIHPKRAEGAFRQIKWLVMGLTLAVYYLTPWLRWDRGPYTPDQAVLIDIANRRFYFFFIEIWPQEFIYIGGLLIMAGLGLFLVTSAVGRAWCGYTCPQTVWVDLFLVVERAVEGDRNARIKLDKAPNSASKIGKRLLKHVIWLLIAVSTGGAWIFYFADAPTLFWDLIHGHAESVAYITIGILTATTYTFGGLMREQVCTYMCPWPRIQAAMLDEHSLTVTYNDWRGEPRGRHQKKALAKGEVMGDCVDCNACVAVCPMGIDIREGQQLECITCALCIDACDNIMDKIGRPHGLISYSTLADYDFNHALAEKPDHSIDPRLVHNSHGGMIETVKGFRWGTILRARTLIYFGIWALVGMVLLTSLATRDRFDLTVQHDRNPLFVRLSDGSIRNGFTVKLLNMVGKPRTFELKIVGLEGATLISPEVDAPAGQKIDIPVKPDRLRAVKIFISQPKDKLKAGRQQFQLVASDIDGNETDTYDALFEAPEAK